ncbi:MAG: type I-E CRISPR-associated protein Cas5/CasD [Thermoanaerobaculia bacterium]
MTDYLVFRLFGPLSSWGDIAVGEVRPSADRPTRSAILGLVAAALGFRRDEEDRHVALGSSLGIGVLVTSVGKPLADYHTVQVPPSGAAKHPRRYATRREELTSRHRSELRTILSRREYRMDSLADVAAWSRNPEPPFALKTIGEALERPTFVPYLGRKSCPLALPMQPRIVAASSLAEAFAAARFDTPSGVPIHEPCGRRTLYWDEGGEAGVPVERTETRRDSPVSRRRWQFAVRREHHATLEEGR